MKHNNYVDGKFQNIEFTDIESDKSIGVIEPGSYNFTTEREETVQCLTGEIIINGIICPSGKKVIIAKNTSFTISAEQPSSYLCVYT